MNAELFDLCLAKAAIMVQSYRLVAPAGFDPRADTSVDTPDPLDYGTLINQEVGGLTGTAGRVISAEQNFQPKFNSVALQNLQQELFGTPAESVQINQGNKTTWVNANGQTSTQRPTAQVKDPRTGQMNTVTAPGWTQQTTPVFTRNNIPAAPGMIDLLGQAGRETAQQTAQTIGQVSPAMRAAYDASDPGAAQLLQQITGATSNDLSSGYNLPPGLSRTVDQAVKASGVGTLGGTGDSAAYMQALGMSQFGNQQYMQRLQNAMSAAGANQNFYGSMIPMMAGASGAALGGASYVNSTANGGYFKPNVNFNDMVGANFNAQASADIASANNAAALEAAGIKAVGSIAGGFAGGA